MDKAAHPGQELTTPFCLTGYSALPALLLKYIPDAVAPLQQRPAKLSYQRHWQDGLAPGNPWLLCTINTKEDLY